MARTYTMTAADVLASARALLSDTGAVLAVRTSDQDMLRALNEALAAMVTVAPGLFAVHGTHTCSAGYLQELQAERAALFLDVVGLPEADPVTLSQFAPGWQAHDAGTAENFMRLAGDSVRFMLYPPAAGAEQLSVRYALQPAAVAATGAVVPVPEVYQAALADYVAGRVSLADDEHMNSGRAQALLQSFAAAVTALGGA